MTVTTATDAGVLIITIDDGAKNALDEPTFEAIMAAVESAEDDVVAFVLTGRDDIFTAGLNINVLRNDGAEGAFRLITALGRTALRLWTEPRPVVVAAAGHAIAAGTMFTMAANHAVVADGRVWMGLTETQVGFAMPRYGLVLAQHNVRQDLLEDLLLPGVRVSSERAVEVGFADELAPAGDVLDRAVAKARELAELPRAAYAGTKQRLRQADADAALAGLDEDVRSLTAGYAFEG